MNAWKEAVERFNDAMNQVSVSLTRFAMSFHTPIDNVDDGGRHVAICLHCRETWPCSDLTTMVKRLEDLQK